MKLLHKYSEGPWLMVHFYLYSSLLFVLWAWEIFIKWQDFVIFWLSEHKLSYWCKSPFYHILGVDSSCPSDVKQRNQKAEISNQNIKMNDIQIWLLHGITYLQHHRWPRISHGRKYSTELQLKGKKKKKNKRQTHTNSQLPDKNIILKFIFSLLKVNLY